MKKREITLNIFLYIFLTAVLLITVFPLVYTIASSFKTNMEIMTMPGKIFPSKPTADNYIQAWTSKSFYVPVLLKNSLVYTLANVLSTLVISAMAGYVFARGHFHFKRLIFMCFTSLMFIKTGGIGIYAQFEVLSLIHLDRSLGALIVMHCFAVPIVNMYLVRGNVEQIPREIDEAAKIDGCSFVVIFFRIILPLLKPILATIAVLSFNASWNDYIMPNIFTLTDPSQRTLIVGLMALKNTGESASSWNLMLAGSVIALIPVLIAFGVCNRFFVKGLAAGAVKG